MDTSLRLRGVPSSVEIRTAARDLAPVVVGLAPFAILIGVTGVRSGAGGGTAVLSSVLLFGGSAQLTAMTLLADGAAAGAVVAAVAVVNARLLLYAAALEPGFRDQPRWFRCLAPHLLVDPTYALAIRRGDLSDPVAFRRFWLLTGGTLGVAWVGLTAVGVALAPVLPPSPALDVGAPAMFLALLVPLLRTRPGLVGAVVGGVIAAAAAPLPNGLGLLCGIAAGAVAASCTDRGSS